MSYNDFSINLFSELEAKIKQLEYVAITQSHALDATHELLNLMILQLDTLQYEYYNHNQIFYHFDESYKPVKATSIIENDFQLAALGQSVIERGRALGLKLKDPRPIDKS